MRPDSGEGVFRFRLDLSPGPSEGRGAEGTAFSGVKAGVHQTKGTVLEINNSINYRGDESPGAAGIFTATPRENRASREDKLVSV